MGNRWPQSGSVERDRNDERAIAARAYFYVGGTTTPLTVFEEAAESTDHDHPLTTDAYGRWPAVFIPYCASYDVKVLDANGVQLYYHEEIPNPDPQDEAPEAVSAEQLRQTGDWAFSTIGGERAGYVRLNGRTIGNAASGATERANADTEDLFLALYGAHADAICAVSGGRGASAAADFAAGKTLTLFDCRGGHPLGLDDMGNSAASRFANTPFTTGNATTAGSICGLNHHALTTAQLATHLHTISLTSSSDGGHDHGAATGADGAHDHSVTDSGHTHFTVTPNSGSAETLANDNVIRQEVSGLGDTDYSLVGDTVSAVASIGLTSSTATGIDIVAVGTHTHTIAAASAHTHTVSGNTGNNGSGDAHNNVSHGTLGTWYIKL